MGTVRGYKAVPFIRALAPIVLALVLSAPAQAQVDTYVQRNLVSDGAIPAGNTDTNLVNGWGVAFNPFGFSVVSANGTGVATVYNGDGATQSLVIRIPPPANGSGNGAPTGVVYNNTSGFVLTNGTVTTPSQFIFATEDGVIAAWATDIDPANTAIRVVDNSTSTGAVYKGLALSAGGYGSLLYAADFRNNKIDVFDSSFQPVTPPPGAFSDPNLPAGFAPFGIQAIGGDIYVSYAMQDAQRRDDVPGQGFGFVNVFDPTGKLIKRLVSQGALNAPWGMALAPAGFGKFGGRLLIGNFGDGTINAYDVATGGFVGTLTRPDQTPVQIDGLWGIAFGNGFENQPVDTLFFAAGPNDETHGLYGRIDVAQSNTIVGSAENTGNSGGGSTPSEVGTY